MRITDKELVDSFITDCKKYKDNQRQLVKLKNQLLEVDTRRYEVSAVAPKEVIIENKILKGFDFDAMEEADQLQMEILIIEYINNKVEKVLDRMDDDVSKMIRETYIDGKSVAEVSSNHFKSIATFYRDIAKEVVKTLSD